MAAVLAVVPVAPATASAATTRAEQRVRSAAAEAGLVAESYVRIRAPLPASAGAHPPACDWVGYLRFRDRDGPTRAAEADAMAIVMPGFLSGAAPLDQLARNFVRWMPSRGRSAEFWALDRRANCRRIGRGLYRAGRRRRLVIGVRRGRVRFVATASRSVLRKRRPLRRYLRYAGVR